FRTGRSSRSWFALRALLTLRAWGSGRASGSGFTLRALLTLRAWGSGRASGSGFTLRALLTLRALGSSRTHWPWLTLRAGRAGRTRFAFFRLPVFQFLQRLLSRREPLFQASNFLLRYR
ncbi:MAG TPA: hypothetical protein VKA18_12650, partial [Alphaproteobacteria bacterium]|nr:hypothetical protein [Alphaproteobacteria bacterium]